MMGWRCDVIASPQRGEAIQRRGISGSPRPQSLSSGRPSAGPVGGLAMTTDASCSWFERTDEENVMTAADVPHRPSETAASASGDPWLLTPGPLTTSPTVKAAMLHDLGSRDQRFIAINRRLRERLVAIIVVEGMIGTFMPADGKLLILVNGAYGKRMARICAYYGFSHAIEETPEDTP